MNFTQLMVLAIPLLPAYVFFVWKGEMNGRNNPWANLLIGLIIVPLVLGLMPLFLLGAHFEAWGERKWRVVVGTSIALVLIAAYGATIHHLRDRPAPSPQDLPVEQER